MWRYITASFWARADVPGLGTVPINAVLCAGVACLGLAIPGIWLIGLGLETAYLFTLATNPRFRHVVDAQKAIRGRVLDGGDRVEARRNLERELTPEAAKRFRDLDARCTSVLSIQRTNQSQSITGDSNRDAFERLTWAYLKLLIAQVNIERIAKENSDGRLRRQADVLAAELKGDNLTEAIRQSKEATLGILRKRLDNLARREQLSAEIASDLERIDAQVDLAIENAAMPAGAGQVHFDLELAGHLLDSSLYGTSEAAVSELDRRYSDRKTVMTSG